MILFPEPQSSHRRSFAKRPRSRSPSLDRTSYRSDSFSLCGGSSFRAGAGGRMRPIICAVCLGRHKHEIKYCRAAYFVLPSGIPTHTPTRCRRDEKGRLFNNQGQPVCYNWQRPQKCDAIGPEHAYLHECSACGERNHGASHCSLRPEALS